MKNGLGCGVWELVEKRGGGHAGGVFEVVCSGVLPWLLNHCL